MTFFNQHNQQLHTHMGCLPGSFDKRDCKLSSLVPNIVIFLLIADEWCWVSGPDAGNELCSEIMPLISSASFSASLYSFTHESEEDAIGLKERRKWKKKKQTNMMFTWEKWRNSTAINRWTKLGCSFLSTFGVILQS